jgi:hypothetical protein
MKRLRFDDMQEGFLFKVKIAILLTDVYPFLHFKAFGVKDLKS